MGVGTVAAGWAGAGGAATTSGAAGAAGCAGAGAVTGTVGADDEVAGVVNVSLSYEW